MMNNIEKKLDALIDALGFDVEVVHTTTLSGQSLQKPEINNPFVKVSAEDVRNIVRKVDYKLVKRHKVSDKDMKIILDAELIKKRLLGYCL
jgi:hypothetical protein